MNSPTDSTRVAPVLWFVMVAVAAIAAAPTPAPASPSTAALDYERETGAERCPDAQALRDGVAARLGYDPFRDDSDRTVRVVVRAGDSEAPYSALIEIWTHDRSEPGVRNLSSSDTNCEKLADTLEFTVSVAIDPGSAGGRPTAGGGPDAGRRAVMAGLLRLHDAVGAADRAQASAARRAADPAEPDNSSSSTPDRDAPSPIVFRAGLGGGATVGTAPSPTGLFRLGAELARRRWSIRLDGRMELPARRSVADGNLETSLALGELAACGTIEFAFGCAVGSLGRLRMTGLDLADTRSGTQLYAATGARAGGDLRLSKTFTLRLQGQLLAALVRTRAVVDSTTVWTTPDFSGSVSSLLVVDF